MEQMFFRLLVLIDVVYFHVSYWELFQLSKSCVAISFEISSLLRYGSTCVELAEGSLKLVMISLQYLIKHYVMKSKLDVNN